jgi:hypothetical protein
MNDINKKKSLWSPSQYKIRKKNRIANIQISGLVSFHWVTMIYQQSINWPSIVLPFMSGVFPMYKKPFRALTDFHGTTSFIPSPLANKFYKIKNRMFNMIIQGLHLTWWLKFATSHRHYVARFGDRLSGTPVYGMQAARKRQKTVAR